MIKTKGPLNSFSFHLIADAFSQILSSGEERNLIKGFQVGKELSPISHIQYADDTLLFLDGEKDHLRNLCLLSIALNWCQD